MVIKMSAKLRYLILYVPYHLFPTTSGKLLYWKQFKKILKPDNLVTFNDKVRWMCLCEAQNNPLIVSCSDKYLVREYIAQQGYERYLNRLIGVWDSPEDIDWDLLPGRFALKCNHGCGFNIICDDKGKLDISWAKKTLSKWMKTDYGVYGVEPHYKKIKRKIICEAYLSDGIDVYPVDYKFYCFNGIPKMILVITERATGQIKLATYDINYNPMRGILVSEEDTVPKPKCLNEMADCAAALSNGFSFVRVDFYVINDRPVFGELTFTPAAGQANYISEDGDRKMGEWFELERERYNVSR
jgi:hypothetical protein